MRVWSKAAVITADVNRLGTAAFILGSNRTFYAECNLGHGRGQNWIHEYRASAQPDGGQNTVYLGHGDFTYRDRFPAEVARVKLDLDRGGAVSAPAVEGFVAFRRATHETTSRTPGVPTRITLYDKQGDVPASAEWGSLPPEYDSLLPSARR